MIVKGTPAAGGQRLADHIKRTDTNERMEVKEVRGTVAEDFEAALLEMEAVGSGSRTKRPFYHASINTRADERLSDAQRYKAIDRLEQELGLTGQPRAIVVHEKKDREHCHVVWLRVDAETMTAIRADHNFRKHEIVARELEKEFGHARVQGAHAERDSAPRPERRASHAEMQQAERTKISPQEAREHITGLWRGTKTGEEFTQALDASGWKLARGDRRDYVAIDPKGGVHSLARRIEGAKVKDVRARMAGVDMDRLPSVAEGRKAQYAQHGRPEPVRAPKPVRTRGKARAPSHTRETFRVIGSVVRPAARATGAGTGVIAAKAARRAGGLAGGLFTALESAMGASPSPKPSRDYEKAPLDAGGTLRPDIEEAVHREQEQKSAVRQKYHSDLSREVPEEKQRDADIERGKGRERTRGE